jgi:hypothetical protein
VHLQDRIPLLLLGLLAACGSSGGDSSTSGSSGSSSGGGGGSSSTPSFTAGGDVQSGEDTAASHSAWASNIQNGTLFVLTPQDPSLFQDGPTIDGFGELSYVPAQDENGGTDVTAILLGSDGQSTAPVLFRIDILPVNDAPSFEVGSQITVEAASGSHVYAQWATDLSPGPENEATQELAFVLDSIANPALFTVPPTLDSANGNLYFNLAPAATGEATITLHLEDDGGLEGLGAANSSESAHFTVTANDTEPPSAEILYPPDGAKTDEPAVRVRGTAQDSVSISFVRVSGYPAGTADGYANWSRGTFPLGPATPTTVQISDGSGNYISAADSITLHGGQHLPIRPTALAYDTSRGRLLFYSSAYNAILSYDRFSGTVVLFSESTDSTPWSVSDLAYSSSPPALYGLDSGNDRVLSFDLNTGAMSLVSGSGVGDGPSLQNPKGLATVPSGGGSPPSLVVTDASFGSDGVPALVSISISSGDRTALSANAPSGLLAGAGTGSGPEFDDPAGIHYQSSLSRFLVVDSDLRALFAVDRSTGDRTLLLENSDSSDGSTLIAPTDVLLSPNGSTAWLLDPLQKKVFAVQMANGTYSLLSGNASQFTADGHKWSSPRDFARVQGVGLFVSDFTGHGLFSVSTSSGSHTREVDYAAGSGPAWSNATSITIDDSAAELLLTCKGHDAIHSIALRDGARALVSGDGLGSGPQLFDPETVVVLDANTLIVTDTGGSQPRVLSINRISGDRTIVSGQGVGGGVSFNDASGLTIDPASNSIYVLDDFDETLTRVDLTSGDRSRIAGGGVGSGPLLDEPRSIAWDANTSRVLLLQEGVILSVDPVTLSRTVLSNLNDTGFSIHESSRLTCPAGESYALVTLDSPLCILKVSISTGSAVIFADLASAAGPPLTDVAGIAFSPARQITYLLSLDSNSLHALDDTGAEHVLFSRD